MDAKEQMKNDMMEMEKMMDNWESMSMDMEQEMKSKMMEGMDHIRKGLDMLKEME